MKFRAVLFDFDGVIADTENVHIVAWQRTFARMGWEVPPGVCVQAAERDDREFLREMFQSRGVTDGDVEGWLRIKQRHALDLLRDVPRIYPGVAPLVRRLSGTVRLGVVSGTWRPNIETVLGASSLLESFDTLVSREDMSRPKPDPSGYQAAAQRLGLEPAACLALEDSPTGLAAARAAGVAVVAVGHRHPPGDWSSGGPFLPDLRDAEAVLRLLDPS